MRVHRAAVSVTVALLLALGGLTACGAGGNGEYAEATVAEDCDLEDQDRREADCGYWQKGQSVKVGARPDATWLWVWYTWVIVGKTSVPPAGWKAPHSIKFPTRTVRVPRKNCALGAYVSARPGPAPRPAAPAPARPAQPKSNTGGNAPANKPANNAPKAPVYKPPAGHKVSC